MVRANVVLPQPDSPANATICPLSIAISTPSTARTGGTPARTPPKPTWRSRASNTGDRRCTRFSRTCGTSALRVPLIRISVGTSRYGALTSAHAARSPAADRAARPVQRELHGVVWTDEYAWMSDHDDARLTAYLREERAYYDSATGHLADLSKTIFGEVERRLLPTDESVSWRRGDLFYYTRTVAGSEYEQFLSSRDQGGPGRVILDETELAAKAG